MRGWVYGWCEGTGRGVDGIVTSTRVHRERVLELPGFGMMYIKAFEISNLVYQSPDTVSCEVLKLPKDKLCGRIVEQSKHARPTAKLSGFFVYSLQYSPPTLSLIYLSCSCGET
jgi:hypothetical protein